MAVAIIVGLILFVGLQFLYPKSHRRARYEIEVGRRDRIDMIRARGTR